MAHCSLLRHFIQSSGVTGFCWRLLQPGLLIRGTGSPRPTARALRRAVKRTALPFFRDSSLLTILLTSFYFYLIKKGTIFNPFPSLHPSCFKLLNIPLFCSPRSVEYRIPGNTTQKSKYPVFKGYVSQRFPDWPFMVRNLTLQTFQSFTLFVHVKMKWSFVSNNAPIDDRIIKATGSGQSTEAMSHCANGPRPDCRSSYHCVRVSKVWPRLPSQPIPLHGRSHLKCKPGP